MNEALEFLRQYGFDINSIEPDGKLHRVDALGERGKQHGWYVAYKNLTQKGEDYYVVRYANWKTDANGDVWRSNNVVIDAEEKKRIESQVKKAQRIADIEKKQKHEQVGKECEDKWTSLSADGNHQYLERKGIRGLYGTKTANDGNDGSVLYIPIKDSAARLWSFQKIYSDGSKRFVSGGRVTGCFHSIGELSDKSPIYITEGFATAVSIHMATKAQVYVAFYASNLSAVSKEIRKLHPDGNIIICGDDDLWTTGQDGLPWNPGREAAGQASKESLSSVVFPVFKNPKKGLTDFNDLHLAEGIDAVREQLSSIKVERVFIRSLGYNESHYYFVSNQNLQIQKLSASSLCTPAGLCQLQPLEYWEMLYPGSKGGINWNAAGSYLMEQCRGVGQFNPDNIRGEGVWFDRGRIVYHMGNKLWINGKITDLHSSEFKSEFIYELSAKMPEPSVPLTEEECLILCKACEKMRWKGDKDFSFFAGWLAIAPICGALPWRPHIWLTGASGSGKSFLMDQVIHPLYPKFWNFFVGNTSEAGIRQSSAKSSRPVIHDEFETNNERSSDKVQAVLELARQASTDSGGRVAKGSPGGSAIEFKPRFSILVSSVRTGLVHEEDKNRFTVLELNRGKGGEAEDEQFDELKGLISQLGRDYGNRLFSRSLSQAKNIIESCEVFRRVISATYNSRTGQQYGSILAGYWSLLSDHAVTEAEAKIVLDEVSLERARDSVEHNDEMDCLEYLMDKSITCEIGSGRYERPIRALIKGIDQGDVAQSDYEMALQHVGIHVQGMYVFISKTHRAVSGFYNRSKWKTNYVSQMLRIDGAESKQMRFKIVGSKPRCVAIPINRFLEQD